MNLTEQRKANVAAWFFLWRYLRDYRFQLLGCITLAVLQGLGLLPIAWLVRRAFDVMIPSHNIVGLLSVGFWILSLNLLTNGLTLATRFASLQTTKRAVSAIRRDLVQHCYALPRVYHDTADRGKLHTLIVQDTVLVDVMTNALIANCLPSLVLGAALVGILVVLNLRLLSLLVLVMPILYLVNRHLGTRVKVRVESHRDAFTRFSSGAQFMLQRIDLTRYQSAESFESRRQHDSIERLRVDSERMAWLQAAYALAQNSAVAFASIVILVVGGLDVAMGRISLGSLLSFYVVTALFSGSLQQLFAAVPHVMEGRQSLCAINSFYSEGVTSPYSGTVRSQFNGSIEFASVCFGYDSRLLLEDASLVLERGSMTAIVGPNGGGKTTLARLILGLYRPRRGRLLADGTPYDQLNIADLRRCIAFAPQDPAIFAGTIWENLTYGLPDSSADKIMKACEFALVHEFVCRLPRGYQTHVDDDGGILSGGQRQKIAIARALACQPRLLILDEPTNHLDEESVQKILHNLRALPRSLTILIITQDRSVAEAIPQKYLLNEGRLTPMWTTSRSNPGTRLHNKPSYTEVTP